LKQERASQHQEQWDPHPRDALVKVNHGPAENLERTHLIHL